jgi:beta-lactam-binding protein with PASTA domain
MSQGSQKATVTWQVGSVIVPNLVGMRLPKARNVLATARLEVAAPADGGLTWLVTAQRPTPGSRVSRGRRVVVATSPGCNDTAMGCG